MTAAGAHSRALPLWGPIRQMETRVAPFGMWKRVCRFYVDGMVLHKE